MKIRLLFISILAAFATLTSCDNLIYDEEGDCSVKIRFCYDYNMKFADAFPSEVKSVNLYVLDTNGVVIAEQSESGEALTADGYAMTLDLEPGEYNFLAWCGMQDNDFKVGDDLSCYLNRNHTPDGEAFIDTDIKALYHGLLSNQKFTYTDGPHTFTIPLVKDTNNVRLVLQHTSGLPVDIEKYQFSITDNNGYINSDNSLLDDEEITYYPWHVEAGEAHFDLTGESSGGPNVAFSAAIAEFTISRLMTNHKTRLTVTNRTNGETVFSIPFIDYAILIKHFYNRDMSDQEYLDRQDTYDLTFFIDEGDRWLDTYIYINSWKVVLQDSDL